MVKVEGLGVPSVAVVLPNFEKHAHQEAALHGLADLKLVVPTRVTIPGDTLASPEEIRALTEVIIPDLVASLVES